jgi:hypothetical protein
MRHVVAAARTISGAMIQNAARQAPRAARKPPTAGPDIAAMPHAADTVASSLDQSTGGKTSRITPCTAAIIIPAPRP